MRDLRGARRAVAAVVVGAAMLTGCSEKQQANETLPSSTAAETSEALPEMGPADFPVPDEARTKDAAGAEAFLRYYIELLNRQRPLLESEPLRELGPQCRECLRIANNYDEAKASGRRYDGGDLSLNEIIEPEVGGSSASIIFGVRQEAVQLLEADGTAVDSGLPMKPNLGSGVTLTWSDEYESWFVENMTLG